MATSPLLTQSDGIEPAGLDEVTEQATGAEKDYGGDGYPDLPEDLQANLVSLARKFCEEDRYSRRLEVQECRRARFYWRGMQHLYWDYKAEGWQVLGPSGGSINTSAKLEESSILYTTNLYQAFGLTISAVLTQNMPSVRFEPEDPNSPADIATAKAGQRYKKIIEHNNDPVKLLTELAYYTWTDGRIAGEVDWAENKRTGQMEEKIHMAGALEVKVPITAECQEEYTYLQHSKEYHVSIIKADVAEKFRDKIRGGAAGNGQDVYERTARISVKQGVSLLTQSGDTLSHLVTRQRTWMRKSAFEMLDSEDIKDQLQELFPNGCMVRIDNGTYTGSWPKNMDDCWAVCHPLPGDGQFRNAAGSSFVPVQERFNDDVNILQDTFEYGLPAMWYDDELFDADAMKRQRSKPAARYPVTRRPGEALQDNFFMEPAATIPAEMLVFIKEIMGELGQFLTGAFPALFGGNTGGNDTARGIGIQRDQAMGRMGIIWRPIKSFWAAVIGNAVRLGAYMRQGQQGQDISIAYPDENGNMETTTVGLEELQGVIHCYPEVDENIPESYTAKRANLMGLLSSPMAASPQVQAMAQEPDNLVQIHEALGLEDLVIPGEDSRNKALMTVYLLLKSTPIPQGIAPAGGITFGPSIQPDEFDNRPVEIEECIRWINSPEGQKARQENPPGFENVKAYVRAQKAMMGPPPQLLAAAQAIHEHGKAQGAAESKNSAASRGSETPPGLTGKTA